MDLLQSTFSPDNAGLYLALLAIGIWLVYVLTYGVEYLRRLPSMERSEETDETQES